MTDRALFWEESEEEDLMHSLEQVALPRDVRKKPAAKTPVTAEPIAPDTRNACDIAATDDAIYELANPPVHDRVRRRHHRRRDPARRQPEVPSRHIVSMTGAPKPGSTVAWRSKPNFR